MSKTIRAKVRVGTNMPAWPDHSKGHGGDSRLVTMYAVYSSDPNHENRAFWKATPQAEVRFVIENPEAMDFFKQDKEYYLDFTEAEPSAP